jgi:outer membrane protein assembly factor BamB
MRTRSRRLAATIVVAAIGASVGVLGSTGHAQVVPPVATGTTGTTPTQQSPPPPVSDPGALGDATTQEFGDAARRGAVTAAGLQPPLRSLWRQDFDALVATAVVGDGRAYVVSGGRVIALDLMTGRRLWTSAAPVGAQAGLAFGAGKVVDGSFAGLIAFDATSGAVAWSVTTETAGGAPLIAGDLVISQKQGLTAFDLATGARRWHGGDPDGVDGAPAAAGDRIFEIGGCTVSAIDRRDGHVLWRRNRGCSGGTSGTVALAGDKVYSSWGNVPLSASDGTDVAGPNADILADGVGLQEQQDRIAAVDLTTGRFMWSAKADTSVINDPLGTPLVVGNTLFQTRFQGTLQARALPTGAVTWQGRLRTAKETFTGSTEAERVSQAAGGGVLLVLRGSTVDALAAAREAPDSLAIAVPRLGSRLTEAAEPLVVRGSGVGELWPDGVMLETDAYPFGRFAAAGPVTPLDAQGRVGVPFKTDRNVRVRLVGANGSAQATPGYTIYAYPRIHLAVRAVADRVRARITVTGSHGLRYTGRRVSLYIARRARHRLTRLGAARLSGPKTGAGHGVVRFRPPAHIGRRDFLFACVPGVQRHGQGAPDPVQLRCGRPTIRF